MLQNIFNTIVYLFDTVFFIPIWVIAELFGIVIF